jgi:transcriptional antiterminator RfaH
VFGGTHAFHLGETPRAAGKCAGAGWYAAVSPTAAGEPFTRWLVVTTHPHREALALENLARQGFEAYCPVVRRRVRHARRSQDVLRPLFPGYAFVRSGPNARNWRPILSTRGVRSLVRVGEQPGYVEDQFIASLKAREVDGVISRPDAAPRVGEKIQILGGAFDGLIATILEMGEKNRIVVLMDLLNQRVKVSIDGPSFSSL